MDKNDFKLTDEQQQLVRQFIDAYREVKKAGVALILCQEKMDSYISFINHNNAECFGNADELEEYKEERIDVTDVLDDTIDFWFSVDYTHNVWSDDRMYALPEGTELY